MEETAKIIQMLKDIQDKIRACITNNDVSANDKKNADETCATLSGLIDVIKAHDNIPADVEKDIADYKMLVDEMLSMYAGE